MESFDNTIFVELLRISCHMYEHKCHVKSWITIPLAFYKKNNIQLITL